MRIEIGKVREAADDCRAALEIEPLVVRCRAVLAGAYWALGDLEAASAEFEQYCESVPDDAELRPLWAELLEATGVFEKAIDVLGDAIAAGADPVLHHLRRGWLYYMLGQRKNALAVFNQVLELDPANTDALDGAGWVHLMTGENERALEAFDAAAEAVPDNSYYQVSRASALARLGRRQQAREAYARAIELEPLNSEIYNSRAYFLHMDEGEWDAAFADISIAIDNAPEMASYRHTLGDWHFRTGETQRAEEVWRQTCALATPGDVRWWQEELAALGHFHGEIDRVCDDRVIEAFRSCAEARCDF